MSTAQVAFGGEPRLGIRDLRLVERAVREYWPITEAQRAVVIDRLVSLMAEPASTLREVASAARTLLAFSKINLQSVAPTVAADAHDDLPLRLALLEAAKSLLPIADDSSSVPSPASSAIPDPASVPIPPSPSVCDSSRTVCDQPSAISDSSPVISGSPSAISHPSSPIGHRPLVIGHAPTSVPDHQPAPARRKRSRHDHRRARQPLDVLDLERFEGIAPFRVGKVSEPGGQ
jgi:hypothetical protein